MSTAQTLYQTLFETLQGLQNGTVSIEKAQAVSDLSQTIVNVAKVEVDYIKATSGKQSSFFSGSSPALEASKPAAQKVQFDDIGKPITPDVYKTAGGGKVEVIGNVTRHTSK